MLGSRERKTGASVFSVAQVNAYIKNMFAQDYMLSQILVKGEASNVKYHTSGHIYFTLKDQSGTIACVMFAGSRSGLAFRLESGQSIVVTGSIQVYERDGRYQLYAREIQLAGAGDLYLRYEQLRLELEERGMFAQEYKQPIPKLVRRLGVVTARTGAAVQDIINVAGRRNPFVEIIVYPAIVQGETAAASVARGIRALEAQQVDVMIVGRGGGSIEDLWAFNEEEVAQAIFDCSIPIISAVGHETDTTIADWVADLRAPTPSAAAELAVADISLFFQALGQYRDSLARGMERKLTQKRSELQGRAARLRLLSPENRSRELRLRAMHMEDALSGAMQAVLQRKKAQFSLYVARMKGVSPLEKLSQGYSYAQTAEGHTLRETGQVAPGDELTTWLSDGKVISRVLEVRTEPIFDKEG